ncbi:MAG: hypothetical protein WAM88_03775 [Nitrososphaeraceae archaeon]
MSEKMRHLTIGTAKLTFLKYFEVGKDQSNKVSAADPPAYNESS